MVIQCNCYMQTDSRVQRHLHWLHKLITELNSCTNFMPTTYQEITFGLNVYLLQQNHSLKIINIFPGRMRSSSTYLPSTSFRQPFNSWRGAKQFQNKTEPGQHDISKTSDPHSLIRHCRPARIDGTVIFSPPAGPWPRHPIRRACGRELPRSIHGRQTGGTPEMDQF
jgi:hypothetical protein